MPPPDLAAKLSIQGPSPEMLAYYYSLVLLLTGDLGADILGPFPNHGQDDVRLVTGWVESGSTALQNRGLWTVGESFVEANLAARGPQADRVANYLQVGLETPPNYRSFCGVADDLLDLRVFPAWQGKTVDALYGVRNPTPGNDALVADGPLSVASSQYQPVGGGCIATAGVFKNWSPVSPWKSLVEGWGIQSLTATGDRNTAARSAYFKLTFENVWAKLCGVTGTPIPPLDVREPVSREVSFELLGNPVLGGKTTVRFVLGEAEEVEIQIHDIAGRRVRALAGRPFEAGEHRLVWEGLDEAGRRAVDGIYFVRIRCRSTGFEAERKLTLLR